MGKAKPVKKVTASPVKISTSLFQRKSKTSQGAGQIDVATSPTKKPAKGTSTPSSPAKVKKAKAKETPKTAKGTTPKGSKDGSTSSPKKVPAKQQKGGAGGKKTEKQSSSPVEPKGKKEKVPSATPTGKKTKGKAAPAPVKAGPPKGKVKPKKRYPSTSSSSMSSSSSEEEREKSTRQKKTVDKRKSRESREEKSPSPRLRSPDSDKVTTRKRSKSDSESPPPQKVAKVGEKSKKVLGKKQPLKKKPVSSAKDVAKKVSKKAVASIVASKKKTVVKKVEKSGSLKLSKAKDKSSGAKDPEKKKKSEIPTKTKPSKVVKVKTKTKPKTKIKAKRMASLNAKAILEASFSFEQSEKKQRSPAPSTSSSTQITTPKTKSTASTSTSTDELTKGATPSGTDSKPSSTPQSSSSPPKTEKKKEAPVSVSTSTSPTPPDLPESGKSSKSSSIKSEKKQRKSTDAGSSPASRRESVSSTPQPVKLSPSSVSISVGTSTQTSAGESSAKKEKAPGKASSRRNSTVASPPPPPTATSNTEVAGKGKEKSKSVTPKKKKMVAVASTTTSTSTSTSPIPMWNEMDSVTIEKRGVAQTQATSLPKQKKNRSNSSTGRDKAQQDSSSQAQHGTLSSHHHSTSSSSKHKSASYQAKEKSTTPVAVYGSGTVYQPAGPLIEPHKQSSVPVGILPETVRLPPDLKVTYQTHPPSSGYMVSPTEPSTQTHHHHHHHHSSTKSSGSSSKSHKSSSSSGVSHKSSEKSSASAGTILHQPYKSTPSSASSPALSRNVPSTFSSTGSGYASSTGTPLLSPSDVGGASTLLSHHHHASASAGVSPAGAAALHGSQLGGSSSSSVTNASSLSMSAHHHPLHSVTPGGSISVGAASQTQNPGAPSSAGLFYAATNYGHSPYAPVKYPMVPAESYRTQSPFPNSFLCPPTTPQPSQSYFMTPFYTPPLTPNPTPGLSTVNPNQGRPMSLSSAAAASHHHQAAAAAAAAAAYYQTGGPLSQQPPPPSAAVAAAAAAAAHLPANYYMPSPQHHSIHPSAAPGHAGPFRPNLSSQPACPCPTDSYLLSSSCTNSNSTIRPPLLQQRPSPSSGSLPGPEAGAKQPKPKSSTSPALVSVTASRPSRKETLMTHPPTCITPAVAADPPTAIQVVPSGDHNNPDVQARQHLESAKTFTEQYSLPDDITITPILPPNPSPISNNPALLMLNSSVSVILTSAPSSTTSTLTTTSSRGNISSPDGLLKNNNSCNHLPTKPREKDIVHVIDPRSGQRTTIAKHISNSSRGSGSFSDIKSNKSIGKDSSTFPAKGANRSSTSRMETVRKLNPDLDVIVINSGEMRNDKTENILNLSTGVTTPATHLPEKSPKNQRPMPPLKPGRQTQKQHPVPFSAISSSVMGLSPAAQGRRVALGHNDNNFPRNLTNNGSSILKVNQKKTKAPKVPSNYAQSSFQQGPPRSPPTTYAPYSMPVLPPGISISAGSSGAQVDNNQPTNLSKKTYSNVPVDFTTNRNQPVNMTMPSKKVKAIKRSLNECIDGLQLHQQQKKLKLLEQQTISSNGNGRYHNVGNGSAPSTSTSARTGIFNVNGGKPIFSMGAQQQQQQLQIQQQLLRQQQLQQMLYKDTTTSARVRGPNFEQKMGGMVINSNDAMTAVSALVVEPFDYSLAGRQVAYNELVRTNGLSRKGKEKVVRQLPSYAFTDGRKKVNRFKGKTGGDRGGKAAAASGSGGNSKSKIRTRLSVKPKGLHHSQQPLGSRSRSRLLRKRSLLCNPNSNLAGNSRKSESDGSICASRSSSTVRILPGVGAQNGPKSGREREREKPKHTQAFLNATADLYQYRRRLILRVPSPKPGIPLVIQEGTMTTAAANLNRAIPMGADAIARFGDVTVSSSTDSIERTEIPREVAAHQMAQLARSQILGGQQIVPIPLQQHAVQESKGPSASLPRTGSMVVNALKKRAGMKPLSPASVNGALNQQLLMNARRQPRWSNGWTFEGDSYEAKVYVKNDDAPIIRRCYPSMRHDGGDVIRTRDCVLLKSGPRKNDLPFIAKIAALWENPTDGEMMFSLLWYYRPEHTDLGRTKDDMMDEIFASKHRDTNSVATIEDRCYVLTFNEYCRYRKRLKQLEQGITGATMIPFEETAMINNDAAGKVAEAVWAGLSGDPSKTPVQGKVSPEVVFFCRKVYDFRQKRILKNPS